MCDIFHVLNNFREKEYMSCSQHASLKTWNVAKYFSILVYLLINSFILSIIQLHSLSKDTWKLGQNCFPSLFLQAIFACPLFLTILFLRVHCKCTFVILKLFLQMACPLLWGIQFVDSVCPQSQTFGVLFTFISRLLDSLCPQLWDYFGI